MNGLENLLLTYAGAVFINTVVSAVLWWEHRTSLHRSLFLIWAASLLVFGVQGAFQEGDLAISLAFSSVFLIGAALASLIDEIVNVSVPWSWALGGVCGAWVTSVAAWGLGLPFAWVSLPVCLAVAFPMVWVVVGVVVTGQWGKLTASGQGLVISIGLYVVHTMDFPFLRDKPEYAAAGFTVGLLLVFALSIFAPATVLELVTRLQARINTELEVAHRIQMELLPSDPRLEGLEIACYMKPAEEVGGDYYDVYSFGEHSWLLLGDVTGHGLTSGLVMLMAQSTISAILHTRPSISPSELYFTANRILHHNLKRLDEKRSMTMVALHRDGPGNSFRFSGQHENLYVRRAADGRVETIEVDQNPHGLGMLDEFELDSYSDDSLVLAPGDLLLVASDGIREAPLGGDYERGMFDEERIVSFLHDAGDLPLEDVKQRLLRELEAFTGGTYHDDVSFVLVRALG